MAQTSIFVSHSHQDNEWCRPFVEALKSVGYDVWYDEQGLQGGAQWVATIQNEVQSRDVFIIVLTPEAWASQWVQDELQLAIATRRRILPVLFRNCQVDGFLLTTQWVTVIGEEPQAAARAVIRAVESPPAPGRSAPPVSTESLDDIVTLCQSLAAEGRYTEAMSACDRALAIDPDNIKVLKVQRLVFAKIGQLKNSSMLSARILQLVPSNQRKADAEYQTMLLDVLRQGDDASLIVKTYLDWGPFFETPSAYDLPLMRVAIKQLVALGGRDGVGTLCAQLSNTHALNSVIEDLVALRQWHLVEECARRTVDPKVQHNTIVALYGQSAGKVLEVDQVIARLCEGWFGSLSNVRESDSGFILMAWRYARENIGRSS